MNVLHIAARELVSTFHTAIGWLVLAGFLLLTGMFWTAMVALYVVQTTDMLANPYASVQMTLADHLLAPFFGNLSVVLLMLSPALAMRSFSEELKQRTMELLLTSPIATAEIVIGKYLGLLGFVLAMLLGTFYVPLTLVLFGSSDLGALAGGYLATFAMAATILAVGMFASALTENQVIALVLAFAAALTLWILPWLDPNGDPDSLVAQASVVTHIADLSRGVVQLSDIVYLLGFTLFFLFATHQRVESFRWS